jgi:hypothetical protein
MRLPFCLAALALAESLCGQTAAVAVLKEQARNGAGFKFADSRFGMPLAPVRAGSRVVRVLPKHLPEHEWSFAVSGDSRNCGDVVMPAIAKGVLADKAAFYWHLGDYRAIYRFDQDYEQIHKRRDKLLSIADYLSGAWPDFIANQLAPFGDLPVYLAIGNHELIPPKTRHAVIIQFADWLNQPAIRKQRLLDDAADHEVKTYYHWIAGGIDFITLDNASETEFREAQMTWLRKVLDHDAADGGIRAVVAAMHEALPDSISETHSMSQSNDGIDSGRQVYQWLLDLHKHKPVYILASHSHFYMEGIFNTPYIHAHGGVLPGWIIGTAGAERYHLPPEKVDAIKCQEHVYGYLTASVSDDAGNPITFRFDPLSEQDVPRAVVEKYTSAFVHDCWENNPAKW